YRGYMSLKMAPPGARPTLRLDRVTQIIETGLESEPAILDLLAASAAKGQLQRPVWDALHAAAARDGRISELASAYDQLLQATKLKVLPPPILAEIVTRAAAFLEEFVADNARAIEHLEKALSLAPNHAEAFQRLEAL